MTDTTTDTTAPADVDATSTAPDQAVPDQVADPVPTGGTLRDLVDWVRRAGDQPEDPPPVVTGDAPPVSSSSPTVAVPAPRSRLQRAVDDLLGRPDPTGPSAGQGVVDLAATARAVAEGRTAQDPTALATLQRLSADPRFGPHATRALIGAIEKEAAQGSGKGLGGGGAAKKPAPKKWPKNTWWWREFFSPIHETPELPTPLIRAMTVLGGGGHLDPGERAAILDTLPAQAADYLINGGRWRICQTK